MESVKRILAILAFASSVLLAQGVVGVSGVVGPSGEINTLVASGEPTFTTVQYVLGSQATTGTTVTATFSSTPTAGNAEVCALYLGAGTTGVTSIKDNAGTPNSFTVLSVDDPNTGVQSVYLAYLLNVPASPGSTITATVPSTGGGAQLRCVEYNRSSGTWTFDTSANSASTSSSTAVNTPSLTPSVAGELLYSYAIPASTISTVNTPWLGDGPGDDAHGGAGAIILSGSASSTAVNMTQASSGTWNSAMLALK